MLLTNPLGDRKNIVIKIRFNEFHNSMYSSNHDRENQTDVHCEPDS